MKTKKELLLKSIYLSLLLESYKADLARCFACYQDNRYLLKVRIRALFDFYKHLIENIKKLKVDDKVFGESHSIKIDALISKEFMVSREGLVLGLSSEGNMCDCQMGETVCAYLKDSHLYVEHHESGMSLSRLRGGSPEMKFYLGDQADVKTSGKYSIYEGFYLSIVQNVVGEVEFSSSDYYIIKLKNIVTTFAHENNLN